MHIGFKIFHFLAQCGNKTRKMGNNNFEIAPVNPLSCAIFIIPDQKIIAPEVINIIFIAWSVPSSIALPSSFILLFITAQKKLEAIIIAHTFPIIQKTPFFYNF
jgi:hypothetical protein